MGLGRLPDWIRCLGFRESCSSGVNQGVPGLRLEPSLHPFLLFFPSPFPPSVLPGPDTGRFLELAWAATTPPLRQDNGLRPGWRRPPSRPRNAEWRPLLLTSSLDLGTVQGSSCDGWASPLPGFAARPGSAACPAIARAPRPPGIPLQLLPSSMGQQVRSRPTSGDCTPLPLVSFVTELRPCGWMGLGGPLLPLRLAKGSRPGWQRPLAGFRDEEESLAHGLSHPLGS